MARKKGANPRISARAKKKAQRKTQRKKAVKKAAKKRQSAKQKRAKSAKKGWATRRRKARAQGKPTRSRKQQAVIDRAEREFNALVNARVEERLKQERAAIERKARSEARKEFLRERESKLIQSMRSDIRSDVIRQLVASGKWEEADETSIIARMNLAELTGDSDIEAHILADEFNMDVREVYTLWFSPGTVTIN